MFRVHSVWHVCPKPLLSKTLRKSNSEIKRERERESGSKSESKRQSRSERNTIHQPEKAYKRDDLYRQDRASGILPFQLRGLLRHHPNCPHDIQQALSKAVR